MRHILKERQARKILERFTVAALQSGKDWETAADDAMYAACRIEMAVDYIVYCPRPEARGGE